MCFLTVVYTLWGTLGVPYDACCVDRLTYILDVSPASGNKSVPVGLVVVATMEDPQCVVVAQESFWWLGGLSSWWSVAALASVSVVCCFRFDRSDPFLPFPTFTVLVLA